MEKYGKKKRKLVFYTFLFSCVVLMYKTLLCASNNMLSLDLENTQIRHIFFPFGKGYLHLVQTKSQRGKAKAMMIVDFQNASVGHSEIFAEIPQNEVSLESNEHSLSVRHSSKCSIVNSYNTL